MLRDSIPPTGIPLPFISAGGTSLSVFMGAIGILCNVANSSEYNKAEFSMIKIFKKRKLKKV